MQHLKICTNLVLVDNRKLEIADQLASMVASGVDEQVIANQLGDHISGGLWRDCAGENSD